MAATKKELILAGAILLAIPLLCEGVLCLAKYSSEPQLYVADVGKGWKLRAGAEGVVRGENRQFVRINRQGWRDVERGYEKPANTVRIAALGNSWTEALQVPQEKTYSAVLERKLTGNACFGAEKIEVLNFGVAGYSTGQEFLTLQQEVWKYQADLVLLALYPARDIANNVRELNNAVNPEQSPYFVYSEGALVLDDSFRSMPALRPREIALQNWRYQVNQHVLLLQGIGELQRWGQVRVAMAALKEKAEEAGVDNLEYSIYSPPVEPALQAGWRVTEGLLVAMRDEVKTHGAEFCVVVLPTRPQVIPELAKREALLQRLGVKDFNYADSRLREFGAREGIDVIELAPALSSYASANDVYLNGFNSKNIGTGHWNETGHRVAAEAIATALCEERTRTEAKLSARLR